MLKLHEAIEGKKLGGVSPGLSLSNALALGLKVDVQALPEEVIEDLKAGRLHLHDPAVIVELLKLNAVVGVTGFFKGRQAGICRHSEQ
jgi:hypothetical protein